MCVATTSDVISDAKSVVKYCVVSTFLKQAAGERIGNTQHFICSKAVHCTSSLAPTCSLPVYKLITIVRCYLIAPSAMSHVKVEIPSESIFPLSVFPI